MATKVGIIYSVAQRRRRVLIKPDDDRELAAFAKSVRPGEKYIEQALSDYAKRGPDAAVADDAGGAPLSDRCAVVDGRSIVVGHVKADPTIDTLPSRTLIQSDKTIEGDIKTTNGFDRDWVEIDATGLVTKVTRSSIDSPPAPILGGVIQPARGRKLGDRLLSAL